jgi:uncharacterized protein YxjI
MRYIMTQKPFSLGDNFTVMNESEKILYDVVEKKSFVYKILSFNKTSGNELFSISQKKLFRGPGFEITKDGKINAEVSKVYSWFKNKLVMSIVGSKEYIITGTFWGGNYTFKSNKRVVAQISRKNWSLSDKYDIEIFDGENHEIILATCVVIDIMFHNTNVD